MVKLVVQVPVDLLGVSVLAQQASQHPKPLHPEQLCGQAGLPGTPPLTCRISTTPDTTSCNVWATSFIHLFCLKHAAAYPADLHSCACLPLADLGDAIYVQPAKTLIARLKAAFELH